MASPGPAPPPVSSSVDASPASSSGATPQLSDSVRLLVQQEIRAALAGDAIPSAPPTESVAVDPATTSSSVGKLSLRTLLLISPPSSTWAPGPVGSLRSTQRRQSAARPDGPTLASARSGPASRSALNIVS